MASGDSIPASSQIPGLSHVEPEEDLKRQNYIRESDSEYVKLAKQGGAKDLLSIPNVERSNKPVDYPKSDWFGHHQMEKSDQEKILLEKKWKAPDYMTYEKKPGNGAAKIPASEGGKPPPLTAREERLLIQAKYQKREVPYQSDNLSFWERKDEPRRPNNFRK
ncbi:uncharacterized protein C7orf57 homolog [Clavelina lepadiformis]|uniref:Uncharacterized protein n=1 Tax=Clavelina lepadiformis TaxID=159417 RepID=A0ABP0F819_CLALP